MKIMKKLLLLLLSLFSGHFIYAQNKSCDLSIELLFTEDTVVVPFGDTLEFFVKLTNHGPDDIELGDRILYTIVGAPFVSSNTSLVIENGNSVVLPDIRSWANASQEEDELSVFCFELLESDSYDDPNLGNNSSCVSALFEGNTTSINENAKTDLTIFPNPLIGDILYIDNVPLDYPLVVNIIDPLGRVVKDFNFVENDNSINLDLSILKNGIYFLEWNNGESKGVYRFVISR